MCTVCVLCVKRFLPVLYCGKCCLYCKPDLILPHVVTSYCKYFTFYIQRDLHCKLTDELLFHCEKNSCFVTDNLQRWKWGAPNTMVPMYESRCILASLKKSAPHINMIAEIQTLLSMWKQTLIMNTTCIKKRTLAISKYFLLTLVQNSLSLTNTYTIIPFTEKHKQATDTSALPLWQRVLYSMGSAC